MRAARGDGDAAALESLSPQARGWQRAAGTGGGSAEAISRNPRLWQARYNRGQIYEGAGRLEEAIADYEAAVEVVGDSEPGLKASLERARAALAGRREPVDPR